MHAFVLEGECVDFQDTQLFDFKLYLPGLHFQATVGGKFPPLIGLRDKGINTMITTYNTVIDAARGTKFRRKNNAGHQRRPRPLR